MNKNNDGLEKMVDDELNNKEIKTLLRTIKRSNLTPAEINNIINNLRKQKPVTNKTYNIGKYHVKYGVISDTHIGNINYDNNLMKFAIKMFDKENVDFVLHGGDIVDGWYQNRPDSLFEQNAIGFDQQVSMAVKELRNIKQPFYFISANHEYNTFMRNAGVEIGNVLEKKLREEGVEAYFLGNAEGDVKLKNGTKIKLIHPDGGSAYAISYKSQKLVESLESGKKPNILHIGHFHKAEYIFYRNVHVFQNGTLEGQTKFMRGRQIPAHKGFWIIEVWGKKGGQVDKIASQWYPAYE